MECSESASRASNCLVEEDPSITFSVALTTKDWDSDLPAIDFPIKKDQITQGKHIWGQICKMLGLNKLFFLY